MMVFDINSQASSTDKEESDLPYVEMARTRTELRLEDFLVLGNL
jgi:hypothetical protein